MDERLPEINGWLEERIAAFLTRMDSGLEPMPEERRADLRRELAGHLRQSYDARRLDGLSREEAWLRTEESFGEPAGIGKSILEQWQETPRYESVGAPLPIQDKKKMLIRALAIALLGYPALLFLLPFLQAQRMDWWVLPGLALIAGLAGWHRWRKTGARATTGMYLTWALAAVQMVLLGAGMYLRGHGGTSVVLDCLQLAFSPLLIGVLIWSARQEGRVRPWKTMSRYQESPVAAEEDFRWQQAMGALMGGTMGCIFTLWMGWRFLGMTYAILGCAFTIGATYFIHRASRR